MHSLRHEILPPSGVEFATSLKLMPPTRGELHVPPNASARQAFAARTLCNVVVARSSLLRIFEARVEPVPVSSQVDEERDRRANVRKGTEAVEGEVAMDEQGEGFVNIAKVIRLVPCILLQHAGFPFFSRSKLPTELTKLPLYSPWAKPPALVLQP
jgi:cleavage and polyadenylation specificity factor subunit 1